MLTPYTTNEEVRATLGVTADELTNETLDLAIYETNLRFEFDEIGTTLAADFKTVNDVADATRTDAQRRFHDAVILFAPLAVGVYLSQSLPLFAPKSITDGKAGISRVADPQFAEILKRVKQNYERFKSNLEKRYAEFKNTTATATAIPTLLAIVSPSVDPIVDATSS